MKHNASVAGAGVASLHRAAQPARVADFLLSHSWGSWCKSVIWLGRAQAVLRPVTTTKRIREETRAPIVRLPVSVGQTFSFYLVKK